MSDQDDSKPRRKKTIPFGIPVDELASTLPGRKIEPPQPKAPESSAEKVQKHATFPPTAWDAQDALVTSAKTPTVPPVATANGVVTLSGDRLSETLAREILLKRFKLAGFAIQQDHQFYWGNTLVNLDGFDTTANVGYQYVSHADADVVTDHDTATEMALKQLAREGTVSVLVIHDVDAPSPGHLMDRIEEFLASIGRPSNA
jgi:hypothetical protein